MILGMSNLANGSIDIFKEFEFLSVPNGQLEFGTQSWLHFVFVFCIGVHKPHYI